MDLFAFPPLAALLDAAHGLFLLLTDALTPISGGGAAAASVVLVTLIVRAALIPVGISQARAEQTRSRLAPRLRVLQKRFANQRERLQRETMKLYAQENASPLAGCLPMLIQAPVVGLIYAVFLHSTIAGHPNALLAFDLLGVPLGMSATGAVLNGMLDPVTAAVFGGIVLVLLVVAELTRRAFPVSTLDASGPAATAMRAAGVLHYATAVIALFVPLAAALYLVVTVCWTLVQRIILRRRFPLAT